MGIVATTSAESTPARLPKAFETQRWIARTARSARKKWGSRSAHSGWSGCASGLGSTPSEASEKASTKKMKIGFDQNQWSCAHQRLIQSSRESISRATSP